jgi:hypothetical protein
MPRSRVAFAGLPPEVRSLEFRFPAGRLTIDRLRAGSHWSLVIGLTFSVFAPGPAPAGLPSSEAFSKEFRCDVVRQKTKGRLISGRVLVGGEDMVPRYDREVKAIPAWAYRCVVRARSMKNSVQGPGSRRGQTGDFLPNVAGLPRRTDIPLHPGSRPEHSDGCFLGDTATTDPADGDGFAPLTLKSLRLAFFDGHDNPNGSSYEAITVEVRRFAP